ncbi:MAG: hypothetical protein WCI02_06990 [Planctomycetota bacterium]
MQLSASENLRSLSSQGPKADAFPFCSVLGTGCTRKEIVEELLRDIQVEYDLSTVHMVRSGTGWATGGAASLQRLR